MGINDRVNIQQRYLYMVLFLTFSEALLFLYFGLARHNNYLSSLNDLGHFDQAIWGFLEGSPFLNTDGSNQAANRLGGHFDVVLAAFVPFYLISPSVNWLILAQSIALPLASLPIYFLALKVGQSERMALTWAAIYLLSPMMMNAASNDFHPVSLATPFIALAYLSLEEKKYLSLLLSCIFILLCKEHFGLLVMGFGGLWFLKHREAKASCGLLFLGGGYFVLVMKFLIPFFSTLDEHSMITGGASRYGWLGNSLETVFIGLVTNPLETARYALFTMNGWQYLAMLFLPLLCLPLLGCEFLLPGLADLLANLLSSNQMPRSMFSYHSVTLVPVLVVSAIYGSRRFAQLFKSSFLKKIPVILSFILTLSLGWSFFPFAALPGSFPFWSPKNNTIYHDANYRMVKSIITPEMSLSVQANVGAHFTQRMEIYRYPNKVGDADAVVLRLESPTFRIHDKNQYKIGSLGNHLQMSPAEYLDSAESLLRSDLYQEIIWADPWLIFKKGKKVTTDVDDVKDKISSLRREWE